MNKEMNLRQLIIDNPELELVPFASDTCGNPEYRYTLSVFTKARVDEYAASPFNDERVIFKSSGWRGDFCDEYYENDKDCRTKIPDEEIEKAFESIEWEKAIIVYIDGY